MSGIEIPVEDVSLDAFDAFVMSGRAPEESMTISDLDGFLTAVAIGPEPIEPSEWLPAIWGGEEPSFDSEDEAALVFGGVMSRYNEIVLNAADGVSDPIFWIGPEEIWVASDWAAGFLDGMMLRWAAWEPLVRSKKSGRSLFPILALCWDENGQSLIGLTEEEEDQIAEEAAACIPDSIVEIADFWRRRRSGEAAARAPSSVGRNEPCPCGSGKKFKKCCGTNA